MSTTDNIETSPEGQKTDEEIYGKIDIDWDALAEEYSEYMAQQNRARAYEIEQIMQELYPNYEKDKENALFYKIKRVEIDRFLPRKFYPDSFIQKLDSEQSPQSQEEE